jgi:hypothetical protein
MADQVDEATRREMEMETREEATKIEFADGDVCDGVLVSIEKVMVREKVDGGAPERRNAAIRYTVRFEDGSEGFFHGTHQLNRKLRPEDRGHRVVIICRGEDPNVRRGENCMKLFDVRVSKNRVANVALPTAQREGTIPEITDDDIPF